MGPRSAFVGSVARSLSLSLSCESRPVPASRSTVRGDHFLGEWAGLQLSRALRRHTYGRLRRAASTPSPMGSAAHRRPPRKRPRAPQCRCRSPAEGLASVTRPWLERHGVLRSRGCRLRHRCAKFSRSQTQPRRACLALRDPVPRRMTANDSAIWSVRGDMTRLGPREGPVQGRLGSGWSVANCCAAVSFISPWSSSHSTARRRARTSRIACHAEMSSGWCS